MDTTELYKLCGLTNLRQSQPPTKWDQAELRFIGADGYVLRTECIEAKILQNKAGIELATRSKMVYPADKLLGTKVKVGTLYDVEVVMGVLTLSLASMMPDMYPKVLRKDQEVELL